MPVRVSFKKQFIFLFLLTLVFLIVVEVLVNIWLYTFYTCDFEKNEIFHDVNEETKRKICLESLGYDFVEQNVSWENGTRLAKEFGGIDERIVNINSEGFRGPEFTKQKPENTYRILVIGGSTTFGAGVFDNQTFPYYLQERYDQTNLDFKVEVINVGWSGWNSIDETELTKTKLVDYHPNLIIVFDGWNDMAKQIKNDKKFSATQWKDRWMEICEFGKQQNFETMITLQPMVGTGKKILSHQEQKFLMLSVMEKLLPMYPTYVKQLEELAVQCSVTEDLRDIFDNVQEPLFFDQGHVGSKGNKIIAENMYRISLPLVAIAAEDTNFSKTPSENINSQLLSNDINKFLEKSYTNLREIISHYKTPKAMPLIFK